MSAAHTTFTGGDLQAEVVFGALADRTRRHLWQTVSAEGPVTATALAARLPITRQAVSKHLRVLGDAGLVRAERVGRETRYVVDAVPLRAAAAWIADADAAWARRLDRLKDRVEARP
jgi:DNA-binding transcriptional ArsR family regulator